MPVTDYDSPWKEALEHYFQDFIAFFYPQAYPNIDWSRGYEFLDKELEKVVRDADTGKRRVDKLARVWRLDGEEVWVLIHVEVQGQREKGFPRRMYVYNYRLFDRYGLPIASFAVLADDAPDWRPDEFHYELWGTEVKLSFPIVKLLDYTDRKEMLGSDANPFAVVVLAHLEAQATGHDPEARYRGKWALTMSLYRRGFDRRAILELYRFIDWLLELPEALEHRFENRLIEYEEQQKMPYITHIERSGFEKGRRQGVHRGVQQGVRQGVQQGKAELLRKLLQRRFGTLPVSIVDRLVHAAPSDLDAWSERILDAESLDDVFVDGC